MPNLWGAIESIREESCWGRCLSSGNRQTRISDSIFTCNSQTSLYREQLHVETLWSTMCASWRLCSQSQSCNEITSPSWRFWLPLHVWGASSEMFLDTDVRSGPKSWNTWTLCTIRLCQIWYSLSLLILIFFYVHKLRLVLVHWKCPKFSKLQAFKLSFFFIRPFCFFCYCYLNILKMKQKLKKKSEKRCKKTTVSSFGYCKLCLTLPYW